MREFCLHLLILDMQVNVSFVYIFTSPMGAVAKYCDEYVCLSVCLSTRISPEPRAIFTYFLCMLPMSMAWYFSGMLMIGCIAYRREGVTAVHNAGDV